MKLENAIQVCAILCIIPFAILTSLVPPGEISIFLEDYKELKKLYSNEFKDIMERVLKEGKK